MLSQFLIKRFVKDYKNVEKKTVRNSYGYLGGIVGVILNIILFSIKLSVGLISNSIAVTADAFNNLSDSASSIITIFGFKLSSKPADKEHPFGHGRIEYISALIVSFFVLLVGIQFIKTSFDRIVNPSPTKFNVVIFSLLILSIFLKIWISRFNSYLGKAINSKALKASSTDAFADVISSTVVAISLLASRWTTFPIDGYIGILVALFILYSGISLIKETLDPLLGEAPDPELVKELKSRLLKYDYVTGVHDLIIHNYGPGRFMATIHAEVPRNESIVKIHEIIDRAEKEISEDLDILLVIHMDPINTDDKEVQEAKETLEEVITKFDIINSFHDFRVVGEEEWKNLIFDIVVDFKGNHTQAEEEKLIEEINIELKKAHPHYNAIITIDKDFTAIL